MSKSEVRTLPLCFASFKVLKQNVNNVSDQKPSRYDVKFEESNRLANEEYLLLCFSSFEWLKENHEASKKTRSSDCIHTSTVLREKVVIIKEHQLHSHALKDH
jgi:hypothetical protein